MLFCFFFSLQKQQINQQHSTALQLVRAAAKRVKRSLPNLSFTKPQRELSIFPSAFIVCNALSLHCRRFGCSGAYIRAEIHHVFGRRARCVRSAADATAYT